MFKAGKHEFPLGQKTYVMGILNCTPDSFSDGGLYDTPEKAFVHACEMRNQGADIIDIGANSTRPDAKVLSADEEKSRLMPVLEAVIGKVDAAISVDTFYTSCAKSALEAGADIINDVSGVFNPEIAELVIKHGAGYIVAHNPCGSNTLSDYPKGVVTQIREFFLDTLKLAGEARLEKSRLCLDVGFGFSKTDEENLEILREMEWLKFKGIALLAAGSRKRFIGNTCSVEISNQRDPGTVAVHTAAIAGGADIIRVHDVASAVQGAAIADAIYRRKR